MKFQECRKFRNEVSEVLKFGLRFFYKKMVCAQEFLFTLRDILENGTASDVLTFFSNPEVESLGFDNLLEHITEECVRCHRYLDHLEFFTEANFNFINTECEVNLDVVLTPYRYASPTPKKLKMGIVNGIVQI